MLSAIFSSLLFICLARKRIKSIFSTVPAEFNVELCKHEEKYRQPTFSGLREKVKIWDVLDYRRNFFIWVWKKIESIEELEVAYLYLQKRWSKIFWTMRCIYGKFPIFLNFMTSIGLGDIPDTFHGNCWMGSNFGHFFYTLGKHFWVRWNFEHFCLLWTIVHEKCWIKHNFIDIFLFWRKFYENDWILYNYGQFSIRNCWLHKFWIFLFTFDNFS